jgi:hypothetical protein
MINHHYHVYSYKEGLFAISNGFDGLGSNLAELVADSPVVP